ncbi:RING finger protein 17 isoform X1 [Eleginops maclovinus]|uniref:RING finger protein 17 isoform X1 n=1 Tax=Eleginops maclovinus TaxID=56733 RepID=UPI003080C4FA
MERGETPCAVMCRLCGEAFTLPEDGVEGNLPRVLLCSHIYCTSCLLSIQRDSVITCPECEVDSTLPEGGVFGLQEDSRIIGHIYTCKMNKKRCDSRSNYCKKNKSIPEKDFNGNTVDVEQTLGTGLADQDKTERARLESEIEQAADKASQNIQKWKEEQLSQLTNVRAQCSTSKAEFSHVQEMIKALEIATEMAREVRCVSILEQHCSLDKVLQMLQAPVDEQSFDLKCVTLGSGMRFEFQSNGLNQNLALFLTMEVGNPKQLSDSPPKVHEPSSFNRKSQFQCAEGRNRNYNSPYGNKLPSPPKQEQESPRAYSVSFQGSSPSPKPFCRSSRSCHNASSDSGPPDVILEDISYGGKKHAPPPTSPEMTSDTWRTQRKKRNLSFGKQADSIQWVIVTHVVNPSDFYIRYVAGNSETLSETINIYCSRASCHFTSSDTVETDSVILVKSKEGLWCRACVVAVLQIGRVEEVKACPITQLACVRVFFLDVGLSMCLPLQREEGSTECSLQAVNTNLKKMCEAMHQALGNFSPQAIRCSLKDLVPYDLTKGWSKEAQVQFSSLVGSAVLEMRPMGHDRDTLVVDLKKAPENQSSHVPISVREYLVFIKVARFYSPVKLGMRPLLYYPPEYPKVNTEINAVVSHINTPADFYIRVENMESLLLFAKIQDCYNATTVAAEDVFKIYCPVTEQACVARFNDKLWYRAQVVGHPAGKKVEVQYVDFGNKKIVSVSDLRKIKDEFFALPSMAIHCCLSEILPVDGNTWSETCCNRFVSLAHQKLVTIVATESVPTSQPLPVKLFESSLNGPQANIAELLAKEELASFKERPKSLQKAVQSFEEDPATWDPTLEIHLDTESVDTPDGERTEEQPKFEPQLKLPDQLKDLKVRVTHVNSPSSFYVQLTQNDLLLKKMYETVKQECGSMEAEDIVWKADRYCAAKINGVWERGQICSDVESDNIAEVLLCDHGNKVKLHISNLRLLPASLKGALALECTLTDIRPAGGQSTWTATACDLISLYLTGTSAVVTIKVCISSALLLSHSFCSSSHPKELTDERPVPVTLWCPNKTGQLINFVDFLANEGLALRKRKPRDVVIEVVKQSKQPPVSQTKHFHLERIKTPLARPEFFTASPISIPTSLRPASRSNISPEKVRTPMYLPPELPCLGNIRVTVSAIGEDGLIYVRTPNAERQLEQLKDRIQQRMKTLPRQKPYTWKSVLGCAVIGPDMLWYRGELLEVLGGHVKVQYVDNGLVENIPMVHVYPVLLCEDVPHLSVPCQLHAINPVGGKWQRDAVALLRELLVNRCADMRVMELPPNPRGPLTVELFMDGMSLSRILCHHQHATMDRTLSFSKELSVMPPAPILDVWDINTEGLNGPEEPMLGPFILPNLPKEMEQFEVQVKHLLTPNQLYLWPLGGVADVTIDGETLDEALTRVNADHNSLRPLTNFRQGAPCFAEYSDGKYYRAELIQIISVEPVMVLVIHVDYGSNDTVPAIKLRQMLAELMGFPSRALRVKVAGFIPPRESLQQEVLPYSPRWSLKATMYMVDVLHGKTTASVVAREPELTVLLYNEDKELVHLPLVRSGLAELE